MEAEILEKERKMFYKFACGCLYPHTDKDKLLINPTRCPKHKKKLVARIFFCVQCGKKLTAGCVGGIPMRCKKCAKERKSLIEASYRVKGKTEILPMADNEILKERKRAIKRNRDCLHYNDCLDPKKNGCLLKNPGACIGCQYYVKKPLDIMDYVKTGGQMPENKYCIGAFKRYDSSNRLKSSNSKTSNSRWKE